MSIFKPGFTPIDTGSTEVQGIPTGGDFTPAGFIAPWNMMLLSTFMTQATEVTDLGADLVRDMGPDWKRLYFKDYDAAAAAAKSLGEKFGVGKVLRIQADLSDVVNIADKSKFTNPVMAYDVDVNTLKSKKRHVYNMIFLPALVAAVARSYGAEVPEFDLSELLDDSTIYNDAFQFKMIGHPDSAPDAEDGYLNAVLWQRRTALWAALGEEDPFKYLIANSPLGNSKYITSAPDLAACLQTAHQPWLTPVWARLQMVNDPTVDAVHKSRDGDRTNRNKIPAFTEIFNSKAAAVAAGGLEDEAAPAKTVTELVLPKSWVTNGFTIPDFKEALTEAAGRGLSKLALIKELDLTPGEAPLLDAWRAKFGV